MTDTKPKTIDEYIKSAPATSRPYLAELRVLLKETVPTATEAVKWGSPVLEDGRILFAFAAFKNHINFMPTPATIDHFKEELTDFNTGSGSVQLPYDKPLPKSLIKKMALHRFKDVKENDARWM